MIARIFRTLAYLRILREARDSYRDFARGGALGDSDKLWPPLDETRMPSRIETHEHGGSKLPSGPPTEPRSDAHDAASRCARGEHREAGESMPESCADCGVDWADLDEEPRR